MAIKKVISDTELGQYMDFGGLEAGKLNPVLPAVNTAPILTVPTVTGNTTNKNEFVTDSSGDKWFIDYGGDGIKFSTKPYFLSVLGAAITSSSNIRTNITAWAIPVTAGKTYKIELAGRITTAVVTTGISLGIITSGGAVGTVEGYIEATIGNTTANTGQRRAIYAVSTVNTLAGSFITTTGVSTIGVVQGFMYFTCTTSGTLQFRWASEINGNNATLQAGAVLEVNLLN